MKYCAFCRTQIKKMDTVDNAGNPAKWDTCEKCWVYTEGFSSEILDIKERVELFYGRKTEDRHNADKMCQIIYITLQNLTKEEG